MIGIPRPCAPRVLFTLLLLGAPAAAQKSLQGVGEEVAPDAAQASPDAVLLINGDEVPAEAYARWLIEEVGPPLMKEFAVDWEIGQQAEALGLAADEAQIQAALDKEIDVRVQGAFRGERAHSCAHAPIEEGVVGQVLGVDRAALTQRVAGVGTERA